MNKTIRWVELGLDKWVGGLARAHERNDGRRKEGKKEGREGERKVREGGKEGSREGGMGECIDVLTLFLDKSFVC